MKLQQWTKNSSLKEALDEALALVSTSPNN